MRMHALYATCALGALAAPAAAQEATSAQPGRPPEAASPAGPEARQDSPAEAARDALDGQGEGEVVVTGSRIQRRDATAVGPLTTLTNQDIAFTAPTSVGDLLQVLPSVGVSLNSNGTQGTSYGVSAINLRYLGSAEGSGNRTLVLVDGHRWVNAVGGRSFRDFVDLNTIPLGIVDRIEVLKDGASAIYGADAIAGVVNIHTKRGLQGFEATARLGVSERGDAENYSGFVNWGRQWDRFGVFLSGSYNDSKPILTSARPITVRALTPLTAAPASPRGLFSLPGLANNAYFGTPAGFATTASPVTRLPGVAQTGAGMMADNGFRTATLALDDYNPLTQGLYSTGPSERYGFFGRANFELTDTINLRLEGLYNRRSSRQLFSPTNLDIRGANGITIARDQAFNPFGTANGVPLGNALAFTGAAFRIQRFVPEVGNRDMVQRVNTYRALAGLDGAFDLLGPWRWDAHFAYSRNKATFDSLNGINFENVQRALGNPANCTAATGCVPLNIFGAITPQQADYIRNDYRSRNAATSYDGTVNVSRQLFDLPGGPLGVAAGYEYRKEVASDFPDAFAFSTSTLLPVVSGSAQSPTGGTPASPTVGSYDLHEVYGELDAPLLADLPLIYRLNVDAAVRYSKYSSFGGKATVKAGVAWRPIADILFRGTYSEGFRAPSILELFQSQRGQNFVAVDPCNGGGGARSGCAGVPAGYNQAQFNGGLIAGITSGNPDLEPETAKTYSAGVAITPNFAPRLSLTVDWFEIKVRDAIASQTATQVLNTCANTGNFCDLIVRNPTGEVARLVQAVVNLSRLEVSGVDATLRYALHTSIGTVEGSVDVSYLDRFQTSIPQPDGSVVVDERAGKSDQPRSTFPHWKGQASLRLIGEDFDAGIKTRYIGPSDDIPNNLVNGGRIRDIFYTDVQVGATLPGSAFSFSLGVDNIFDQLPPRSAANNPINFDIYTYDIRGRYFYTRLSTKF